MRTGDSMTRQIFMRLINLFRGEERSFDYAVHTAARYDVCGGPFPADRYTWQLHFARGALSGVVAVCISRYIC